MSFILRFLIFAAIHSLLATPWCKEAVRHIAGKEMAAYRLFYNLLALALFAWVMADDGGEAVLYFVPGAWSLVMYLLQLFIAVALFSCIRQTGVGSFLGTAQVRATGTQHPHLETGGWYAVVRHPLYLLCSIFLILTPVMTIQRALLTALSMPYFIIGGLLEERRLQEEFGSEYLRYRQRVPFLIPDLRPNRRPPAA